MATIFSKIIAGEIPSHKVAENDRFFAFLDINPLTKGHTLVVPKQEVDYLFDLDDETLAGMMLPDSSGISMAVSTSLIPWPRAAKTPLDGS